MSLLLQGLPVVAQVRTTATQLADLNNFLQHWLSSQDTVFDCQSIEIQALQQKNLWIVCEHALVATWLKHNTKKLLDCLERRFPDTVRTTTITLSHLQPQQRQKKTVTMECDKTVTENLRRCINSLTNPNLRQSLQRLHDTMSQHH